MEYKTVRAGSLRAVGLKVMFENQGKPREEVIPLIEKALGNGRDGKSFYHWAVKDGYAPGDLTKPTKAPQPKKKPPADNKGKPVKKETGYMPGKFAEEKNPGVEDFDEDEARHEIDVLMSDVNLGRNVPHFLQD